MKNYYDILGIDTNASSEQIKKAYRQLAQKYHPDAGDPESTEAFHEINEAYECLSDSKKRQAYDLKWKEEKEKKPSSKPLAPRKNLYKERVGEKQTKAIKAIQNKNQHKGWIKVILTSLLFFLIGFFLTWLLEGNRWLGGTLAGLSGLFLGIYGNFDSKTLFALPKHQTIFKRVGLGVNFLALFYFVILIVNLFI